MNIFNNNKYVLKSGVLMVDILHLKDNQIKALYMNHYYYLTLHNLHNHFQKYFLPPPP